MYKSCKALLEQIEEGDFTTRVQEKWNGSE
jgi:hypothetical protein